MKEGLWEETLDKIRENMPENEFSSWFGRLVFGKEEDGKITLYVPSAFVRDRFETTYKSQIESILRTLGDDSYSIAFEIKKNAQNQQIPKKSEENLNSKISEESQKLEQEERELLKKNEEKFNFNVEVTRLMDIIINSLYTNKEVFIRELI